jgi:hypothetical protein
MASDPQPAPTDDLQALLGDLIGDHGRLEVAYRTAATAAGQPLPVQGRYAAAARWEQVLQVLHRATSLASGLAAGHTTTPNSHDQDAVQACAGCARRTAIRIYGHPWHYTCWLDAGCPLAPPGPATTQPAADAPQTAAATTGTPKMADGPAEPAAGDSGPLSDAAGDKTNRRRPTPVHRWEPDLAEEAADFRRAVRRKQPTATDEDCEAALAAWHAHVTHNGQAARFVSTPGYTGVAVYEWLTAQHGAMARPVPLADEHALEICGDRRVLRVLSFVAPGAPQEGQAVTEADVTAQYLGGARSAELGDGDPVEFGPVAPDDQPAVFKRPGWVELGSVPDLSRLPVTARCAFAKLRPGSMLATPAARYLSHDHHLVLDVAGGLGWPQGQHGRRLSTWCALFADALAQLSALADAGDQAAALAAGVVKSVYATFLGGMTTSAQHNDKGTLRPDWHDQYVTQAGVNALRAVDKALANGATVLGGMKDSFWFLSDAAAAPVRPVGMTFNDAPDKPAHQPGKWHVNRFGPVTPEIIAAHKAGRVGVLRKAITASDTARKAAAA